MLNTNTANISQARYDAVAATQKHLRRNGASLCDLLDALDDPAGFEALCRLHSAFSYPFPDADAVEDAVHDIIRFLADQSPSSLDRIGTERNFAASDMARWHGARISEIYGKFRHAR
ncbi:hypothetical protein HTT03_14755 [Sulfitobacter sp. S0837]|uniref:hypothetical protein n=1 Tax=Sulfitobacter maritimus TaxID=2741719 RepID=UPI0015841920|nr:hypothetical protein [Sulfitobacter maritimus]NUH66541.1 hypothetical protein [Sulfitobacter maritimus]